MRGGAVRAVPCMLRLVLPPLAQPQPPHLFVTLVNDSLIGSNCFATTAQTNAVSAFRPGHAADVGRRQTEDPFLRK